MKYKLKDGLNYFILKGAGTKKPVKVEKDEVYDDEEPLDNYVRYLTQLYKGSPTQLTSQLMVKKWKGLLNKWRLKGLMIPFDEKQERKIKSAEQTIEELKKENEKLKKDNEKKSKKKKRTSKKKKSKSKKSKKE